MILFLIFIASVGCQVLNNIPITFLMGGSTTYTPDSGGALQNGYKIKIGFRYYSWLGIQFEGTVKNDVLIMQINDFYSNNSNPIFAGHQVTITDYNYNGSSIILDQITSKDISSYAYSNTKTYSLDMIRYLGSNNGQDWDPNNGKYSLTKVCFYTSDYTFDASSWRSSYSQCYFYEINNLESTFKGVYLKDMSINGYLMSLYGWIDGPFLTSNVFFFQNTPLYTYQQPPAFLLEIGQTNGNYGQDYYAWSPTPLETGDYYGNASSSISMDNSALGFSNLALTAQFWNAAPANYIASIPTTAIRLSFSRNISTFDAYDRQLKSTFSFCLYLYTQGSINSQLTQKSCQVVELSYYYPRTSIIFSFQGLPSVILMLLIWLII